MKISALTIVSFLSIAGARCVVNADDSMTACNEEIEIFGQCFSENSDDCPSFSRKLGRDSRSGSSYSLSNGHHVRHLEDGPNCDSGKSFFCDFLVDDNTYKCPCVQEYIPLLDCGRKFQGLFCDELSVDACGDIPCFQEKYAFMKCLENWDDCKLDDEGARKLGRDGRSGSSYSLSNGHHGRHLEDGSKCDEIQGDICALEGRYPSCSCIVEDIAYQECYANERGFSCEDLSVNMCDDTAPSEIPSDAPSVSTSPSEIPSDVPSLSTSPSEIPSDAPSLSTSPSEIPSDAPSLGCAFCIVFAIGCAFFIECPYD